MEEIKVKISMSALLQRLQRKLKKSGHAIKKARRKDPAVGDYFELYLPTSLIRTNVNPTEYAVQLGVLKPYEKVI